MLLVHPVREVGRYIPVLVLSVIVGTRNDNPGWGLVALAVIVGFAIARWFTTTYRIGPDNLELRTGVLQRKRLAVPRTRIRSVDIEASPLHRLLGLAVLTIGTGQQAGKDEQFKLDALDARLVPGMRAELLKHLRDTETADAQGVSDATALTESSSGSSDPSTAQPPTRRESVEIGHWQPNWVRYAPLSLTGFALVAPVVGLAFQYGLAEAVFRSDAVHNVGERSAWFLTLVIAALVVAVIAIVSLAGCARYLTTFHGLRVLDDGRTLHIRHGLFTTRQTTLDLTRLRGATVNEPLLLRLAGGAELEAVMVGTNPRQKILPQAPRAAVDRTLGHLLASRPLRTRATPLSPADAATGPPFESATGAAQALSPPTRAEAEDAAAPARIALTPHGPQARRRRYTRALAPVAVVAVALIAIAVAGVSVPVWAWAVLGVIALGATALAHDRYRGLGHAVLPATAERPTWLITRSGSLDRDRDCLEAPGIIGWTVRQTFLQRRAGLATLVAATAAGKKRYHVVDVPVARAWELIEEVTPGHLGYRAAR
ncbi:PH domain-containing protein [Nocardia blacklockiae]|uniref:PH domain-containing protein n=1 Tax=Nocardia blacklockiae TaxID=480036 RepID=UPI0018936D09|nr:PH domain-containing protein [Nocardia blacklockiae]MBF6174467.1 PH domain-containing protein [Nocardia blacklockiae]